MAEIGLMGYPEISHSEHFFEFDCKMPPKPWVIVTLHSHVVQALQPVLDLRREVLSSLVRPGTDGIENRLKWTGICNLENDFLHIP